MKIALCFILSCLFSCVALAGDPAMISLMVPATDYSNKTTRAEFLTFLWKDSKQRAEPIDSNWKTATNKVAVYYIYDVLYELVGCKPGPELDAAIAKWSTNIVTSQEIGWTKAAEAKQLKPVTTLSAEAVER